MDERTYGPAEICQAAGVPRATFHSWLARKYLSHDPGPGMGKARAFTLLEAVRVGVIADLGRLGLTVSLAADLAARIKAEHIGGQTRAVMVLGSLCTAAGDELAHEISVAVLSFAGVSDLESLLYAGKLGRAVMVVDVSRIARETLAALDCPDQPGRRGATIPT